MRRTPACCGRGGARHVWSSPCAASSSNRAPCVKIGVVRLARFTRAASGVCRAALIEGDSDIVRRMGCRKERVVRRGLSVDAGLSGFVGHSAAMRSRSSGPLWGRFRDVAAALGTEAIALVVEESRLVGFAVTATKVVSAKVGRHTGLREPRVGLHQKEDAAEETVVFVRTLVQTLAGPPWSGAPHLRPVVIGRRAFKGPARILTALAPPLRQMKSDRPGAPPCRNVSACWAVVLDCHRGGGNSVDVKCLQVACAQRGCSEEAQTRRKGSGRRSRGHEACRVVWWRLLALHCRVPGTLSVPLALSCVAFA